MLTNAQKLAKDAYFNVSSYSKEECDDIIRNMIFEHLEPLPEKKSKYRRWLERNGHQLFDIMEELITPIVNELTTQDFANLVDVENFDLGDKKEFTIENEDLFDVALIANGLKTVHRQRIYDRKVETNAFRMGVKIYAEAFDFLKGSINWTKFVDKVARSFERKMCALIVSTLFGAYDAVGNPDFCVQVNQAGLADKLREMIAKIGVDNLQILGTQAALAKIENAGAIVDMDKEDHRNFGYVKVFEGVPCTVMPNHFDKKVGAFDVPNDMLMIIPAGEKIVKLGNEGDVEIYENTDTAMRADYQIEMEMNRRVHLGVAIAARYAIIKLV